MQIEGYELEDSYGNVIYFLSEEITLLNKTNYGTAPINYSNTSGFLQDGETVNRWNLQPRNLQLNIFVSEKKFKNRKEYWNYRNTLLKILNPFAAPLKFTITRIDGTKRQLTNIYPQDGINFVNDDSGLNINETISLSANSPFWINPETISYEIEAEQFSQLRFPITFPIVFNAGGQEFIQSISYNGTWKSYPQIIINGSFNTVNITNGWNGAEIGLFVSIGDAEQRIINLNPQNLYVQDADGNDKFGDLEETSNLVNFYFHPLKTNSLTFVMTGSSSTTTANFTFNEQFIGI